MDISVPGEKTPVDSQNVHDKIISYVQRQYFLRDIGQIDHLTGQSSRNIRLFEV